MAIHEDFPGITATVLMDDGPIPEYDIKNDDVEHEDPEVIEHQEASTVTKYIECIESQPFSINIEIKRPYRFDCNALSFEFYVDGEWIATEAMMEEDYRKSKKKFSTEMKGLSVQDGRKSVLKPFVFAKIKIAKSENITDIVSIAQKKELADVGEIEVQIDRRSIIKSARGNKTNKPGELDVDYSKKCHPKPLIPRGETHGSVFGEAEPIEKQSYVHTRTIDGDEFPLIIFKWKYRSKRALQSLLVIPELQNPVSKVARQDKSNREDRSERNNNASSKFMSQKPALSAELAHLTSAQIIQLAKLADSMKNKDFKSIKTEGAAIKREGSHEATSGQRAKRPKKMVGKVTIDLTGDDSDEEKAKRVVFELD